jgi:transposase, IS30 family
MGQRYNQLSLEDRCTVARLQAEGRSIRQIAADLDRAPSTIARELKRNASKPLGYTPSWAATQSKARRWHGARLERDDGLRDEVLAALAGGWSPEQTCAALERRHGRRVIGVESIYRFIHAQIARHKDYSWRHYLPRGKSKRGRRGRRGGSPARLMKGRIPISERPAQADDRATPGHWEADLMLFSKYGQAVLAVHERSSRLLLATMPHGKVAGPIAGLITQLLGPLPQPLRRTITFDNGTEFARHSELQRTLALETFFCDPHSPWQKGGIENAIGRMRRVLPRKTDLAAVSKNQLDQLLLAYNNTPRKCLDWLTPAQAFCRFLLHFERESTFPLTRE